ncbi:MAG: hypothetical protein HY695_11825 [Deltaproteobacteria bacterium]|nr:hypothetical protein [Deltaproteobacteria bacterium]
MADFSLTLACDSYDVIWPLEAGTAKADGLDLQILKMGQERHERMMRHNEFDACEIGVSHYLMAHLQGKPFRAIPVFIRRMFLHRFIYCHTGAKIYSLEDLRAKQVGIIRPSNMLGLWLRGLLRHDFGIDSHQVRWIAERGDVVKGASGAKFSCQTVPSGKTLEGLLSEGKIDALVVPELLRSNIPGIKRLFPDYKTEEAQYYKKTRMFPIMHLIVLKQDVLKKEPSAAVKLVEAFREAKRQSDDYLRIPPRAGLAWASALWEEERAILGDDPWAYNVRDNVRTLQTIIEYAFEDGLIDRKPEIKDLFAESTLEI